MSKQVDVLSELDRRIEIGELFEQEHDAPNLPGVASLREARAAVAELIEAVKEDREALQAFSNNGEPENVRRYFAAEERLIAALARCNGGAA